jgi:hypothetical protein
MSSIELLQGILTELRHDNAEMVGIERLAVHPRGQKNRGEVRQRLRPDCRKLKDDDHDWRSDQGGVRIVAANAG